MIRLEGITSGGKISQTCRDETHALRTMDALNAACALDIEWSISPIVRSRGRKSRPGSVVSAQEVTQ